MEFGVLSEPETNPCLWEKQIFKEGPDLVTTNDMAVMTIDGKEVIFFGTDKGLFTFVID